ncbi:MAG: hypothetical protein KDA24_03325 [Deltaproteobacteria bacterium]|nr:hypothetical protein [Deltaproteobacteria bacterium]
MSLARRIALHAALALLTLVVFAPHHGRGLMLYDLGELLLYTQAFLDGKTPGLDFIVNGYGPGRYLLIAALSVLTRAAPMAVAFGVFIALRVVISSLALEVGLRFVPDGVAGRLGWLLFAPLSLLLLPGPLHKGFFLAGSLALLLGATSLAERPTSRRALRYGALIAVCAVFRVDLGLYGALALALVAWRTRSARTFAMGSAAPLLGWLLLGVSLLISGTGVLSAVAGQVWFDVAVNHTVVFPTFPSPRELITQPSLDRTLLWLPLLVYGALFGTLVRSLHRDQDGVGWLLLLLGVLTCNQVRMKPEFGHLLQAGPLMWLALAFMVSRVWERSPGRRPLALVILLVPLLLVVNTLSSHRGSVYTGSFTILDDRDEVVVTAAGPLRLADYEEERLVPVLRTIDRAPPGSLWVPSNQPLLHALSGRENTTGYVGALYVANSPEREADLIRRLEAAPPPVAVFVDDSMEGPERSLRMGAPTVFDYLQEHYTAVGTFGEFVVMQRR